MQTRTPSRSRSIASTLATVLALAASLPAAPGAGPALSLHPENPHYFLFRGKPLVVVTSGEHYGAVLNLDFNYAKYLETLAKEGMNGTRTWAGPYCEPPHAFGIASNTLAPLPGRYLSPWARSQKPGYPNGGNKFDLDQWDPAFFQRLKDFMSHASRHGIIVEMNLFCPFYEESMWRLSPMNAANNVSGIGNVARTNVYTLEKHGGLLEVQDTFVRKMVTELNQFDNLYYEICNEPYFGGVTLEWQAHIARVIHDAEKSLPVKHLISQNIANDKARVDHPDPLVSIFNFHYATPPTTVEMNYGLNKVIGDNETGFKGTNDSVYRMEGWDFIVAGGGLYNNLDYSFVAGYEDGTFVYPQSQPGGGSTSLRRQLRFLQETVSGLDFVKLRPQNKSLKAQLPPGCTARLLASDREYLVYLRSGLGQKKGAAELKKTFAADELSFELKLGEGDYTATWLDTTACKVLQTSRFTRAAAAGPHRLTVPAFSHDIALVIRNQ